MGGVTSEHFLPLLSFFKSLDTANKVKDKALDPENFQANSQQFSKETPREKSVQKKRGMRR